MSNGQCRPDEDDSSYWVTEPDHEYDWEEASVCASIFISLCDLCYVLSARCSNDSTRIMLVLVRCSGKDDAGPEHPRVAGVRHEKREGGARHDARVVALEQPRVQPHACAPAPHRNRRCAFAHRESVACACRYSRATRRRAHTHQWCQCEHSKPRLAAGVGYSASCEPCPAGAHSTSPPSDRCVPCGENSKSAVRSTECTTCAEDEFSRAPSDQSSRSYSYSHYSITSKSTSKTVRLSLYYWLRKHTYEVVRRN